MKQNRFSKFAWGVLAYNVAVVVWGAYVRATGSGAGCGSHWPLCNGVVIPREPAIETIVEFSHRLTSGLAFLLVLGLFLWARRAYSKGHHVRLAAGGAMLFMISESLVGASLVLFEWVAGNISTARVVVMGVHLLNTFVLLAFIALAAWWSAGGKSFSLRNQGWVFGALLLGLVGVMVMSMAGSVTALGDTLFPSESLAQGLQQDFEASSHFLIRLRVWHPFVAVGVGAYLIFLAQQLNAARPGVFVNRASWALRILYVIQLGAGVLNLVLLVPVWMQLIHLLLAVLVWITLILLTAVTLAESSQPVTKPITIGAS
ncbi:MAG: COX15/CtaA family protein [Ardenticatenaceae bacterium]|nr:COX15/CtaA family protein [Ardenticatenaceae bacterium]MCB9445783.1 COX15/CtaA family protein [Ardenticatenaceae bacterium]